MPKARKQSSLGRVARRVAVAAPLPITKTNFSPEKHQEEETDLPGKQNLSRGQRRRLAKREQYLKREKMILSSLQLKTQEEQKGRIDGLNAIRDALLNTTKDESRPQKKEHVNTYRSNKGKKRLLAEEAHHMSLVSFYLFVSLAF